MLHVTSLGCASVVLMLVTCLDAGPTPPSGIKLGVMERSGSYSLWVIVSWAQIIRLSERLNERVCITWDCRFHSYRRVKVLLALTVPTDPHCGASPEQVWCLQYQSGVQTCNNGVFTDAWMGCVLMLKRQL